MTNQMESLATTKAPQNGALAASLNGITKPSLLNSSAGMQSLFQLIDEVRLACSLPALDPRELTAMGKIWGEVLSAEGIPAERWRACLIHCLRTRESTFAVNVSELCAAWREIRHSFLPPACPRCQGTKTINRFDDKGWAGVADCPDCQPKREVA